MNWRALRLARPPRLGWAGPLAARRRSTASREVYERLSPVEHVLRRPGMYIGSVSEQTESLWLYDDMRNHMVQREARYIPGLYKIFDEILVNALDNLQRDPGTNQIDVTLDPKSGRVSVTNTGRGIAVRMHESEGVWVPELVLGSLYTGSNFDDREVRTVGGRHGFGAKLTNIFSREFEVDTADAEAGLRYVQSWSANMSERGEPLITPLRPGEAGYTRVTFLPDLGRFGVSALPHDMVGLFRRRVMEAAASAGGGVRVTLDGKHVKVNGLRDLMQLYHETKRGQRDLAVAQLGPRWQVRGRDAHARPVGRAWATGHGPRAAMGDGRWHKKKGEMGNARGRHAAATRPSRRSWAPASPPPGPSPTSPLSTGSRRREAAPT